MSETKKKLRPSDQFNGPSAAAFIAKANNDGSKKYFERLDAARKVFYKEYKTPAERKAAMKKWAPLFVESDQSFAGKVPWMKKRQGLLGEVGRAIKNLVKDKLIKEPEVEVFKLGEVVKVPKSKPKTRPSDVEVPKSKPNKSKREAERSIKSIKDEVLRSGNYGSSDRVVPSLSEAVLIAAKLAKKKLKGKLFGNSKGGAILKKNIEKMAYGGMSGGKKHMYSAGGSVSDNVGLRALKKASPKAYNKIKSKIS